MTRTRYQKGCLKQITRKGGLRVWIFRWRETGSDGTRVARKIVVGSVRDLPTEKAARSALDDLNLHINLDLSEGSRPPGTFGELVEHYRRKELAADNERTTYSTRQCYETYLKNWIVPRWGTYKLMKIENGVAVFVEEWLSTIQRSRGTKAKIRNIMSAVCAHAIRYSWMKTNPIHSVRQSAKRERIPKPLTAEELQGLLTELELRDRVLVLMGGSTGMRRGELLALQWDDIDFEKKTVNIRKSIYQQEVGPVKTEESEKTMPLAEEMVVILSRWRDQTPYAQKDNWIFASPRMGGVQPLWPEALMRNYIVPAAKRAHIDKHISWHVFRHTFSTLLAENNEDGKTMQSLMRHANISITMNTYTHAVSGKKRQAQSKVVEMILPRDRATMAVSTGGIA